MSAYELSLSARANICAALRHWQREDAQDRADCLEFAGNSARPFSDWELDELRETLSAANWVYAVDRLPTGVYILVRETADASEIYCGRLYQWQPESRADTARENYGPQAVLRAVRAGLPVRKPAYTAELWDTGGGGQAIGVQPVGSDLHWLITGAEGAQAPDTEDEPVALGLYVGDWWVCFDCDNLAGALRIIRAFVSHSGP